MALITCPECGNSISDKAERCPHCGLPSAYFGAHSVEQENAGDEIDYHNLNNVFLSFDKDYSELFSGTHYISHRDVGRYLYFRFAQYVQAYPSFLQR